MAKAVAAAGSELVEAAEGRLAEGAASMATALPDWEGAAAAVLAAVATARGRLVAEASVVEAREAAGMATDKCCSRTRCGSVVRGGSPSTLVCQRTS